MERNEENRNNYVSTISLIDIAEAEAFFVSGCFAAYSSDYLFDMASTLHFLNAKYSLLIKCVLNRRLFSFLSNPIDFDFNSHCHTLSSGFSNRYQHKHVHFTHETLIIVAKD